MYLLDRDLTVVIPAFGNTPYLAASIESALRSPAISILIADDASGPAEQAVFAQFTAAHPDRIRVIRSERRRGIQRNLNEALRHVRTAFCVRLDCDDALFPGHVENAVRLLAERPALALVAGKERRIGANECMDFRSEVLPEYPSEPRTTILSGLEAFRFALRWSPNPCSSGTVYRTAALREAGGFDEHVPWGEDWEVWLRLARRWELAYVDAPSALYRIHDQATTSIYTRQNRLCYGYDYVYRRAAELCRDPEFMPDLRRAFLKLARYYAGAAWRQARRFQPGALKCALGAVRALLTALLLLLRVEVPIPGVALQDRESLGRKRSLVREVDV